MAVQCKLVAYKRVSTKRQGDSGLGLEGQEATIAAHVATSGCRLVASYTEVESGKLSSLDRPQLALALAHARRSKATLVVAKLDRLSRNVAFLSALMESRVPFFACDNPHATPLTIHILVAVAEDEVKRISERTKAALAAKKARGEKVGTNNLTREGTLKGAVAGGLKVAALARSEVSDILPLMVAWRAAGATLQGIADRLNREGHTTRTDRPWNKVQVKRVLDRSAERATP